MVEPPCAGPDSVRRNWVPLLWLVYLLWLPVDPILSHAPAWQWIATGLSGLAIAALYVVAVYGLGHFHPVRLAIVVACFALGVWVMTFNVGASSYFVYGAGMIGYTLRPRAAWVLLAAYCLAIVLISGLALHGMIFAWSMALVFSSIVGVANIRSAEDARANAKLRIAHDEVERLAKVAERERIARDLHDVLGHTLSLIVLKSELASKLTERDAAAAAAEIRDVETIARGALQELREAVTGYKSAGIAAEIDRAKTMLETAGVRVEAHTDAVRLPPTSEGVLALAIREAVTNVVRHAQAHAVRLQLAQSNGTCRFEIVDDGRGSSIAYEGNGLGGMRERIEALGGTMERETQNGTRLVLTLPAESRA
jgi:two-component system sensor histidine kinase DesK